MKGIGFDAPPTDGKKRFAVSLIMAILLAAVSTFSVFAAPLPRTTGSGTLEAQLRELAMDRAWYNSFRSNHKDFISAMHKEPNRTQRWLAQYVYALGQAGAIVTGGPIAAATNQSNMQVNSQRTKAMQQKLGEWLHEIRQLREKLAHDAMIRRLWVMNG